MKAKKAMKVVQTQANAKKTRTGRGSRRHRIEESARGVMTLYSCMQGRRFLSGLLAAAAAAAPASAVVRFRGCGGASTNARCARVSLGHCLKRREAVAQGANVLRLAKLEASLLVARMRHRRGPHGMRNVQVGNTGKQQGARTETRWRRFRARARFRAGALA